MGEPREHEEGMGGVAGWARLLLGAVGYHLAARFSLTLIAQPCEQLGTKAVNLLLKRIRTPDRKPQTIRLAPVLKIRNSCGCG